MNVASWDYGIWRTEIRAMLCPPYIQGTLANQSTIGSPAMAGKALGGDPKPASTRMLGDWALKSPHQ